MIKNIFSKSDYDIDIKVSMNLDKLIIKGYEVALYIIYPFFLYFADFKQDKLTKQGNIKNIRVYTQKCFIVIFVTNLIGLILSLGVGSNYV